MVGRGHSPQRISHKVRSLGLPPPGVWSWTLHGDQQNDAPGQNRKKTHFGTEVLLERKRRQEVKGVKRYTVLT